ncbi:hypothetical protein F5890DRAFT_1448821 [Lentinula detonsa]|uniref:Uncharacterized protein n=1 Tax=Lentinula detonsa TaxID=2804962 RepID=A0AA38PQF3_9AGAR|nr:hypothetical protein F5890DRAFT_1448821 [Lentinula detonsa]
MMSADSALPHTSGTEPRHCFIPHIETCVSFSLDVRRTLNLLRCEIDDEIETAIQNFPIRKYVAVVRTYENTPLPGCMYHRAGLRLLQQGTPESMMEFCFESHTMCFPVASETDLPLNRSPFRTNKPLPWDGCYHVSCMDRIVYIPLGHFDYANAFVMDMYSDDPSDEDTGVARAQHAKANGSSQTGDIVEDLCPSSPSVRKVVEEAESLDNSSRENRSIDHEPSSLLAQSAPRSDAKPLRFYSSTVRLAESLDELSDESFIGSESDADSQSESWFSAEEGFSTDEEENNSLNDSHYIDDTIPRMNHISEVSTSFDGYNADGSIVPVVNFSLDLSGIPSLLSVDEYSKDYDMLDALVRKCRERSTPVNVKEDDGEQSGSSLLCTEGALDSEQSTTSSTTSETSHISLKETSNECVVSNTDLGASKQAKRSKLKLKSSRVGRLVSRIFSTLNTGK